MEKPFQKITETDSLYDNLEAKSIGEILSQINAEDHKVAPAVKAQLPAIERLLVPVVDALLKGGRLFYIGAGTSGRLGILDASECPPTFGVSHDLVVGLIAGGDAAIRKAVEFAEDDLEGAWKDLQQHQITTKDVVVGIAASGTTPYVLGGIRSCKKHGITTGGITCNPGSPLAEEAQFPIVIEVGPEYVTGSSRMKAGTAQKLVLNCITT
ncbi:MAG: N-acetylmuramic acid 6-phosphate etherase, partial [Flavobacteriaceae bacterium]|nr:N-acetylmuramic acid 6-phosphate etherase [Flavobacteriaceae bacterium]